MQERTLLQLKSHQVKVLTILFVFFTQCYSKLFGYNSTVDSSIISMIPAEISQSLAEEIRKIQGFQASYRHIEDLLKEKRVCLVPKLDPYLPEVMQFVVPSPTGIRCPGEEDYVKCYLSKCRIVDKKQVKGLDFLCTYTDIILETDNTQKPGRKTVIKGTGAYTLQATDHVAIRCKMTDKLTKRVTFWKGHGWGLRNSVKVPEVPKDRKDSINVVMIGFDTVSHNHFIRKMPKSYEYLKNVLGATFLNGYNVVGDGTTAALLPLLSGIAVNQLPEEVKNKEAYIDHKQFIFHKIKKYGYRTAYFEDLPWLGTFQLNHNGFRVQPADHYSRAFYLAYMKSVGMKRAQRSYCVGGTPSNQILMNVTDQILNMEGKKFVCTFIGDITHDDINMFGVADDNFAHLLNGFFENGYLNNTLLVVFGDHGPRYDQLRTTYAGRIEERLPLMAIRLPEILRQQRPEAQAALESNIDVLTTPHDVHATLLDAMDLRELWNPYKVTAARYNRALTLLEQIPQSRSCGDADISPHWCTCQDWNVKPQSDPIYEIVGKAFVDTVNSYTEFLRPICISRELESIEWVMQQAKISSKYINYQVRLTLTPKKATYEATLTYDMKLKRFYTDSAQISRINAYGSESHCVQKLYPYLLKFCYCRDNYVNM